MGQPEKEQNIERAERAAVAVRAFAKAADMEEEANEILVSDLLCNLRHHCRFEKIDWHRCVARAHDHFDVEVDAESREYKDFSRED